MAFDGPKSGDCAMWQWLDAVCSVWHDHQPCCVSRFFKGAKWCKMKTGAVFLECYILWINWSARTTLIVVRQRWLFVIQVSHNSYPYHPCMVYLPTFGWFLMGNVGKYLYHTWMLWDRLTIWLHLTRGASEIWFPFVLSVRFCPCYLKTFEQWEKSRLFRLYRGWKTTQLSRDYFTLHEICIPIKQPVFHGK